MTDEERRAAAVKRLKDKRDFRNHVAAYVLVNGLLVAIWALSGGGYFWPIWSVAGWGLGLAFNARAVFFDWWNGREHDAGQGSSAPIAGRMTT